MAIDAIALKVEAIINIQARERSGTIDRFTSIDTDTYRCI